MKHLFLMLALMAATSTHAASDNDTTVINNARKVIIVTGDSLQKVRVEGTEDNDNYLYENTLQLVDSNYVGEVKIDRNWNIGIGVGKKTEDNHWENTLTTHLGFGMTAPTHVADGISFTTGSSWEIFWTILQWDYTPKKKSKNALGQTYSIGFGVDWRNYRMTGNQLFEKDEAGNVAVGSYPEGANPKFSRIKVFSLNVPLLFRQDLDKRGNWSLAVGPVVNLNTYASIKTRYKKDGGSFKVMTKDIPQRPVTVDFMGILRTPIVDMYLKYSPMDVLKSNRGPEFQSLSFGLYL